MNGDTLKVVFIGIIMTLCLVLLALTGLAAFGKISIEIYEKMMGVLGIPTLFGMIAQSFLHADFSAKEKPSVIK